ncbi:spindle assembly checkpoint kinase [Scheffersomyces spartinae]|uniref:Aurora kinase n=1 Tax=Scheffersomyces spartinae TaxID=45513 RepID=A0A9P8AKR5_9ASCO|nr:spindle assembly checkpoint kinase [Scheffersomyces spartinae]KAG7196098.1 spindle assembly checkpoint kinase [Scheffersomyces spartinae]
MSVSSLSSLESRIKKLSESLSHDHTPGSKSRSLRKPLSTFVINTYDNNQKKVNKRPSQSSSHGNHGTPKLNSRAQRHTDIGPSTRFSTSASNNGPGSISRLHLSSSVPSSPISQYPIPPSLELSIKDFEVGKPLGRGKLGRVYCCRHIGSNYVCALKVMSKEQLTSQGLELNLRREIEISRNLVHPKLCRLLSFFHDDDNVYLVIEYAVGGELYYSLKKQGLFNNPQASNYTFQLTQALIYLRLKGVVHRDIKPENILVTEGNNIKLSDFGWSVKLSSSKADSTLNESRPPKRLLLGNSHKPSLLPTSAKPQNKRHTLCGTLDYLPPEMIESKVHDAQVDNWALGVLIYEMLVGKPPFEEADKGDTYKRIVNIDVRYPDYLDPLAKDLIGSLLQKIPSERLLLTKVMSHPWIVRYKPQWKQYSLPH